MGHVYKRKTTRVSYAEEDLKKALAEINSGRPLFTTAKAYDISARTFRRHRDKKVANPGCIKLGRFKPDINEEYKAQLVIKIQSIEKLFGLTTKDLRRLAFDFATQMNIQHRFNTEMRTLVMIGLVGFYRATLSCLSESQKQRILLELLVLTRPKFKSFLRFIGVF